MMKLFEEDWVREATSRIASDAVFQKKAKGFDVVYQYVVKWEGNEYRFAIKYPEAQQYWMGDSPTKPDFVMTTSYKLMHDILTGKTNAVLALTTRKLFVSGSLPMLLRYTGAINRAVELFQSIKAEAEAPYTAIPGTK